MEKLIATIHKGKPFFDQLARNRYLKAVKDGFISCMPIVIFSSIFLLVAYVPNIWGFTWPPELEAIITKPYGYSMGILSVVVAATTAKHFTDSLNRDMPRNNQINFLSTMVCATVGLVILASDPLEGGFSSDCLGSKGLLTAFAGQMPVRPGAHHAVHMVLRLGVLDGDDLLHACPPGSDRPEGHAVLRVCRFVWLICLRGGSASASSAAG